MLETASFPWIDLVTHYSAGRTGKNCSILLQKSGNSTSLCVYAFLRLSALPLRTSYSETEESFRLNCPHKTFCSSAWWFKGLTLWEYYKEVARGAPFPHLHFTGVFLTYHAVFLTACVRVSNASTTHLREYENRWKVRKETERSLKEMGKGFEKHLRAAGRIQDLAKWMTQLLRMEFSERGKPRSAYSSSRIEGKYRDMWGARQRPSPQRNSLVGNRGIKKEDGRENMIYLWQTYWRTHLFKSLSQNSPKQKCWVLHS